MDLAQQIDTLRGHLMAGKFGFKDTKFAKNLIYNYGLGDSRKCGLSAKQTYWVGKLIERAEGRDEQPKEQVGDMTGLITLFGTARQNLKFPKIALRTPSGQDVVLKMAGDRSRYPGTINVTDGKVYGDNRWFGRVEVNGTWTKSRKMATNEEAEIGDLLRRMSEAPTETAAEYGKMTGHCCFCRRHLHDERSTEVGYGPNCAKKYGLAWGNRPGKRTTVEQAAAEDAAIGQGCNCAPARAHSARRFPR